MANTAVGIPDNSGMHQLAYEAHRVAVMAGLDVRLEAAQTTVDRPEAAELSLVFDHRFNGLIHEQLAEVFQIAEAYEGRCWHDRDGELAIVWPSGEVPGPKGQDGPAVIRRREARDGPATPKGTTRKKAA